MDRTTCYVVSPYSRGGLQHAHYSTLGIVHTMEITVGLKPLSLYDATAIPLYAAFTATPHMLPFNTLPQVSLTTRNTPLLPMAQK